MDNPKKFTYNYLTIKTLTYETYYTKTKILNALIHFDKNCMTIRDGNVLCNIEDLVHFYSFNKNIIIYIDKNFKTLSHYNFDVFIMFKKYNVKYNNSKKIILCLYKKKSIFTKQIHLYFKLGLNSKINDKKIRHFKKFLKTRGFKTKKRYFKGYKKI